MSETDLQQSRILSIQSCVEPVAPPSPVHKALAQVELFFFTDLVRSVIIMNEYWDFAVNILIHFEKSLQ